MNAPSRWILRWPLLFALAVTMGFILLIIAGNRAGAEGDELRSMVIETATRVVAGLAAIAIAGVSGHFADFGFSAPHGGRPWTIVIPPTLFLMVVFPLLFTGSMGPNLARPGVTALVALDSFMAGAAEELVYRGLVFSALALAWGPRRAGVISAAIVSSLFFSIPHITNVLAGHQPLRVAAQIVWAFLLGIAFALLAYVGESVWPVAVAHGLLNAVVATNRMGRRIELSPSRALVMTLVPIPVLIYTFLITRRTGLSRSPVPHVDTATR